MPTRPQDRESGVFPAEGFGKADPVRDAWLDLILGCSCAACGRPGRLLCTDCARDLPTHGQVAWPTPCPAGLVLPMAAGEYDGVLKVLVNAHKERGQFALARPLGAVLAHVVRDLTGAAPGDQAWCLVPVPSRGGVVRRRGHDPMLRVTRRAAVELRRGGVQVVVSRLLEPVGVARDQAGLGAEERADNLHLSMRCSQARAARQLRRWPSVRLLVVDDVVTTGSTAREAQRALECQGLSVSGIAAVAATRRQWIQGTV